MTTKQRKQLERYWKDGAEEAWKTTAVLFEKRRYAHALFFCHLTLEKILKALIIARSNQEPPYSHDLRLLATKTDIALNPAEKKLFDTISTFNIRARYDTDKRALARLATRTYTKRWFVNTTTLYLWLKKQYPKR